MIVAPEQMVCDAGVAVAPGVGFTVIVNDAGTPVQVPPALVNCGVTVIVADIGAVPALIAVKDKISPLPLAARPIDVVVLTQLNTVPAGEPVKLTVVVAAPLQTV